MVRVLTERRERKWEATSPGGRAQVVTMSPLPARGTGSCGPAVPTSAPQPESAAATVTMGGKNKQRTKGNLRVRPGVAALRRVARASAGPGGRRVTSPCVRPRGWAGRGVRTQTTFHTDAERVGACLGEVSLGDGVSVQPGGTCPGRRGCVGAVGGRRKRGLRGLGNVPWFSVPVPPGQGRSP